MSLSVVKDFTRMKRVEFSDDKGKCNTPNEIILEQVASSIRRGLPQISPHPVNPNIALLVCGGPSLEKTEKELREAVWRGGKLIATNGSYQWCMDRNLKPTAMIMLDAREFNSRFVAEPVPQCRYILASQCHPKTFDLCKDREVFIWHAITGGQPELDMVNAFYFERCYPIVLGTTVGIRAISLLRMIGFTSIEIFGLDSCWMDDKHHSYDQPENNRDRRGEVWLRAKDRDDLAKKFLCAPWHMKQADDFMVLVKDRGDLFQLNVHGDGLLATIIRTGAEIEMSKSLEEAVNEDQLRMPAHPTA